MRSATGAVLMLLYGLSAGAVEVAGVGVEPRAQLEQQVLQLNGAGVRSRFFFKVYVAALYLSEPSASAAQIVSGQGAKRMELTLLREVSSGQWVEALRQGLEKNNAPAAMASLQPRLAQFEKTIEGIGEGRAGDRLQLDYVPGVGTVIRMNGQRRGAPIAGDAFYRALLSIWLGEDPVQANLKRELLGGPAR